MKPGRYIVSIVPYGNKYFETIRTLALGVEDVRDDHELRETQKYIFAESAGQIFTIFTPDVRQFLVYLTQQPHLQCFAHITKLNDPYIRELFCNAYREFAYGIMEKVRMKPGIFLEFDYLIEGIAEDHMVIHVVQKHLNYD